MIRVIHDEAPDLSVGLITVDRHTKSPVTLISETGETIKIQLPPELESQPTMTSLTNLKLKIIP
jgi:hypothetical protein